MNADAGKWIDDAVARYERPLISYAARLLHHDLDAARDVVQDAFLKLCAQNKSTVESHLAEWLFAVVRNRASDVRRKEVRMSVMNGQVETADANDPARNVETSTDGASIVAMLDSLPPNQAEVIRLKFQHGLSYEQIAGVTKLSSSNVGYLIHTGLKTLRDKLRVTQQ